MLSSLFIKNNKDLLRLYDLNVQPHPENHYGTFEQFLQVIYSFREKAGFDIAFAPVPYTAGKQKCFPFTLKTDDGTEIDFINKLRIKITIDRKREDPFNLGEAIWWEHPDGSKTVVGCKKKNTRVFEYFVFSTIQEFHKFAQWTNNVHTNKIKLSKDAMLSRSKESERVKLDVEFNYWNLDKEAKKIYNMKEKELDKILKLDIFADQFKELEAKEKLRITDTRK